jgi:hypothetical protein
MHARLTRKDNMHETQMQQGEAHVPETARSQSESTRQAPSEAPIVAHKG